ncbi:MAG: endo-1,4-beta-xylanase [Planctomycetes bacterium]|nr:endo-1,4-beta-xylanase [Planctomycetota bacterium]
MGRKLNIITTVFAFVIMLGAICPALEPDPRDNRSPWGIASGAEWANEYPKFNPLLSAAGVRWLRIFPGWHSIEKNQGEFNWEEADKGVADAKKNNIKVSGMFVFFPKWASANGKDPRACPVKDIKFWSEYVKQAVTRYKGEIKYWEIWNEFNGGFASSKNKPKDYADMVKAAYIAAKEADPTCMIGMSCANFDLNFFDKSIKAGAAGHFDYICVHPYENLGEVVRGGGEPGYLSMAGSIRKMLADNKQKTDMPLWITEIGYQAPVKPDAKKDATQTDAIVKAFVLSIVQGFDKIEWFEARGPQYGKGTDHGIIRADWTPRPSYEAVKLSSTILGIEPNYAGWLKIGEGGYGFVFEKDGQSILVAWAPTDAGLAVKFASDVTITNLAGKATTLAANAEGKLARAAVFITGLPAAMVEEARANKGKKFPWGGDFSKTDTVSCIMGSNMETGLRNTNPEEVKVVNALDHTYAETVNKKGKRSHHISYRVHHTFVTDNPRDFEITLVAKRGAPAKKSTVWIYFYESMSGYKPTGDKWEIPDDDNWHEKTWTVTNANFVGQWGYNFCFGLGGNPFLIKEVRVKKIAPKAQE